MTPVGNAAIGIEKLSFRLEKPSCEVSQTAGHPNVIWELSLLKRHQ
jgi:hypothetical protein